MSEGLTNRDKHYWRDIVFFSEGEHERLGDRNSKREWTRMYHARRWAGSSPHTQSESDGLSYHPDLVASLGKSSADSLLRHPGLWTLDAGRRVLFVQLVIRRCLDEVHAQCRELEREYHDVYAEKKRLRKERTLNVLRKQRVVGMTINGCALNPDLIREWKPDYVLAEESGECLEPAFLSVLGPWIKQVVSIGDHRQLPPIKHSLALQKDVNFTSMFARLVRVEEARAAKNKLSNSPSESQEFARLHEQHRMRPELSKYLRPVYSDYRDDLRMVRQLAPVDCVAKPCFFWDLPEGAEARAGGLSFVNHVEADACVRLALFMLDQGLSPARLVILSAYRAQADLIRQKMGDWARKRPRLFEALRGATLQDTNSDSGCPQSIDPLTILQENIRLLDGFQGRQADYVLVSWVRSNAEHLAGFLKSREGENRRVVAQSRARLGVVFVGHAARLEYDLNVQDPDKARVPNHTWKTNFLDLLRRDGCVGPRLPIRCVRHPETSRRDVCRPVELPDRFGNAQILVCREVCDRPMACGHRCRQLCHGFACSPTMCEEVVEQACLKNPTGHPKLRKVCGAPEAPLCRVKQSFRCRFNCGRELRRECHQTEEEVRCEVKFSCAKTPSHILVRECYQAEADVRCRRPCERLLPRCGHRCPLLCHEDCGKARCQELITTERCAAGAHEQLRLCSEPAPERCYQPCASGRPAACGHACSQRCGHAGACDAGVCADCAADEVRELLRQLDDAPDSDEDGARLSREGRQLQQCQQPRLRSLRLSEICWSQHRISRKFRSGLSLAEARDKLLLQDPSETLTQFSLRAFPPLEVVRHQDVYWSMDNRRLWLLSAVLPPEQRVEVRLFESPADYGETWFRKKWTTKWSAERIRAAGGKNEIEFFE